MYYTILLYIGSKALTLLEDCFHLSISEQDQRYQLEKTKTCAKVSSGSSVVQVL